jgi:predicted nucleic acid-binding protein
MAMIADTDVLVDFLIGREPGASAIALSLETGDLAIAAVTRFELLAAARSEAERERVGALLAALPTLPLSEAAAQRAAEVRRAAEEEGREIGFADSLIAGIALNSGGILLTADRARFEAAAGLTVVDL